MLALSHNTAQCELNTFEPCTVDEVNKIIENLDSNSSTGLDGISTKVIKSIKELIITNLTNCLNKLLSEGVFPDTLKVAKVSPIYKSGSKTDPGNYRPISVLPVISKIFEKILHIRLETHLQTINFIYKQQYGFRSKSNTLAATIDLVTKIKSNIDKKNIVVGIFIDLKKAFDTVSHNLLIKKLERIGVKGNALKMFESYLSNRMQVVKIENTQSKTEPLTCGVPQGSILGPLLFLIYINNVHELSLNGDITLYADDTCLFYFGASIHTILSHAQKDLNNLFSWFQHNLLTINISKTCYIIFKAKNKPIPNYDPPKINNVELQEKNSEKYLGLHIDSCLTWNTHITHVKSKLSSLTGSVKNVMHCVPRQIRYTIYNCLVKPHLLYLIELWGSAVKSKLAKLQISQNKLVKLLFNIPYLTSTETVYKETKIMNIRQLYKYTTCILVRKILTNKIHTNLTYTKVKEIRKRSSRRASYIVLPKTRTNYGKKTILCEGAQLYNKLPSQIKSVSSFNAFKFKLAQHIMNDDSLLNK